MLVDIRPYTPADLETLRALLADPGIAPQFDMFQGPQGLEHMLGDPYLDRSVMRLATVEDQPAGFGVSFVLPDAPRGWAMTRVAVVPRWRRRGIGRALALASFDAIRALPHAARIRDLCGAAWLPNEAAERLASGLGMKFERAFWLMERPRGASPAPEWPEGVTTRTFDGSEAMLVDWNDAYNDSFAEHWRFVPGQLETTRHITQAPGFRADGLVLAYRDGRCLGYCRNELHESRGELALIGTVKAARGIGLGRALLRWGVDWLERHTGNPVTLMVDGDNDNALRLYRSEGFEVVKTRRVWSRDATGA